MKYLTFNGGAEEDQGIVEILAVALQGDLGIIGEFEVEVEATWFEGIEVQGVRRLDGEMVEEDQDSAIGRDLRRERIAEKWKKDRYRSNKNHPQFPHFWD